jgi:hypothetical protein
MTFSVVFCSFSAYFSIHESDPQVYIMCDCGIDFASVFLSFYDFSIEFWSWAENYWKGHTNSFNATLNGLEMRNRNKLSIWSCGCVGYCCTTFLHSVLSYVKIIIITYHPIISPVLINILSFSGTLYVVCLLTSVAIVKYNIIHIYK